MGLFAAIGRRRAPLYSPFLAAVVLALVWVLPARADNDAEALVLKSRLTAEELLADKDMGQLPQYVEQARGVLIFPQLLKGGFIVGGEGGSGVLLARDSSGQWGYPAFYTMAAGSIGLQIGGQVSQVILTVMNEEALDALLGSQFKLGGNASVAAGPVGAGIGAATTTNLDADIFTFSKSKGLYGGASLEGAAIFPSEENNKLFYGDSPTPAAIIVDGKFSNPKADGLRNALP